MKCPLCEVEQFARQVWIATSSIYKAKQLKELKKKKGGHLTSLIKIISFSLHHYHIQQISYKK